MSGEAEAPALELAGVGRAYRTKFGLEKSAVLAGIDLRLERGRALGLAGPNGAGKTTLLRIAVGAEDADAGTVRVFGLAPNRAARQGWIGWLDEELPFPPAETTPLSALRLMGSLQGLRGRALRRRTDEMIARFDLEKDELKSVARCSRGTQRRLGLAQAWIHEPRLLVLDEPTAGLDARGFEALADLLAEARAQGTAVLLASHLATDLLRFCDEVAVLLDGRIAVRGAPGEVLAGEGLLGLYRRSREARA